MKTSLPFDSLDVIGYAKRAGANPGSGIAPVFKVHDSDQVLMPPVAVVAGEVVHASVSTLEQFDRDCRAGRCGSIRPTPARPHHELRKEDASVVYAPRDPSW